MTVYVQRNGDGAITGAYANLQPGYAEEGLADDDAELAAFLNPPPSPLEVLGGKLASGIAITSTGTPALSATYALDAVTLDQIGSVARDAAAGLGLPGGGSTFVYPDASGTPHTFAASDVQHLYKAMRDLVFALNEQMAVAEQGGSPVWPTQTATIA